MNFRLILLASALALPLAAPAKAPAHRAQPAKSAPAKPAPAPLYPHGMVSAADPRAAAAGAEMLRAGGSAVDAALAVMLALTVVEPQSSGIGGGGFLLTDDGKGHLASLDGRERAPAKATPDWFIRDGQPIGMPQAIAGGRSVGVPGNIALMAEAHKRWGKLPWAKLFAPAIRLAGEGYDISPRMNRMLGWASMTGSLTPEGRALWYGPNEEPLPAGTHVKNPALAAFFTRLAKEGPAAFYAGSNAVAVARAVNNAPVNPAPLAASDLAAYKVTPREPLCTQYRGWKLCGMAPPSSGATTVFGVLGMVERFDLAAMGKDSPAAWHVIAEAMRLAYADRDRYLADADFVKVPAKGLIDPGYLSARGALIAQDHTMPTAPAGTPPGAQLALADTLTPDVPSTSHFVTVDPAGRVVSYTSTVESPFGSGLIVNGYILNNELTDFSQVPVRDGMPVANRVEAGKRPRSAMSPTLVYDPAGKLRLAIGAAGGATIPAQVVKAIIAVIDWHLPAREAIALPVIFAPGDTVFVEKGTSAEALIPALTALGHKAMARDASFKANAIEIVDGEPVGAADPRSEGSAVAP
ncbi:MAG: gamma-glutamyltransferase [Proteobacteria bacterium]|nr:gamma-glutamyltransferase [Pseudomonadota bacterium]